MGARRPASASVRARVVKTALERLDAEAPRCEIVLELARLEQRPRSEPAHVAIGDVRAVV